MRNQPRAVSRLLGVAVLATLLAACGSGGDSDSDGGDGTTPVVIPADVVRIEFVVSDKDTKAPVDGAVASYLAGNKTYGDTTGPDGRGSFDVLVAELATTVSDVGTVSKNNYESYPLLISACKLVTGGNVCKLPEVELLKAASNVSIPVNGDAVWHLGDDLNAGDTSLFQKSTDTRTLLDADASNDQPYLEFAVADWATKAGGYTKATVTLDIKGMETAFCPDDAIALIGDAGASTLPGKDSPADGSWRPESFEFAVADVGAGSTNVRVRVTTGKCPFFEGGQLVNRYDDFEINRLRVEFSK